MFLIKKTKQNLQLSGFIFFGFVLCTIIGTVSHEAGHCLAAKILGYKPTISYAYMDISNDDPKEAALEKYYKLHKEKITRQKSSPEAKRFGTMLKLHYRDQFIIIVSGPLQTVLTGTIGFMILFYNRKKIYLHGMKIRDWLCMLLAFFWSRQLFNFVTGVYMFLKNGRIGHSDETKLARYYKLPFWSIDLAGAILSILILSYLTFIILRKNQRSTFILSGIAGSIAGWLIWMNWVGLIVLP